MLKLPHFLNYWITLHVYLITPLINNYSQTLLLKIMLKLTFFFTHRCQCFCRLYCTGVARTKNMRVFNLQILLNYSEKAQKQFLFSQAVHNQTTSFVHPQSLFLATKKTFCQDLNQNATMTSCLHILSTTEIEQISHGLAAPIFPLNCLFSIFAPFLLGSFPF